MQEATRLEKDGSVHKCNDWFHQNCENIVDAVFRKEHLSPVVFVRSN